MIERYHCTEQKHLIVAGSNYLQWDREICMEAEFLIQKTKTFVKKKKLLQVIWLVLHILKTNQFVTKISFIWDSSEVYSGLFQTFKMECFVKLVNGW